MTTTLSRAMGRIALVAGTVLAFGLPVATQAQDNEFAGPLNEIAGGSLREIAQNDLIVAAIKAQNEKTAGYDQAMIDKLDGQWRAEVGSAAKPLIDATLGTAASKWLVQAQDGSAGVFTEIFVMDARGLNVAQSTVTSDYWQGDEAKFSESFGVGPDAVHLGEIEQDESTQTFQSQVSIAITDPATGAAIGAITAGIDLALL
jgi:hypothetical protein